MKREGESPFKKGLWTVEEDKLLMDHVKVHGKGQWNKIARKTDLKRSGKSCRLRWMNYLSPNVKKGDFSEEEEDLIIRLHKLLGNRWSLIAKRVPGRTDNQVKNYWNSHLSKKLGIKGQSTKRVDSCQSFKEVKVCECNHQAQATIDPSSSRTSTGTTEIAVDQGCSQNQTAIETGHEVLSTTNTQESAIGPSSNQISSGTLEMAVCQGCNPNQKAIETVHEVLSTTNIQESVVIHDQSYMNPLWIPGDDLELSTLNMMGYFDECSSMYLA